MSLTPKNYLSFSQMTTFEMSPEKYAERYLYNQKQRISRNMAYGSQLASGLEEEEATGDPLLDLMASRLPKFELMDMPIEDPKGIWVTYKRKNREARACIPVLKDGKIDIPLLAMPDTAKSDYGAFYEYKTSTRKWTQKMADESGQITFYDTAIWLKTGKLAEDIELIDIPVEYLLDGSLCPTGEMLRFKTQRTLIDIIKMTKRMKAAWRGIQELCEKELL